MEERYALRRPRVNFYQTWSPEETMDRIDEADVFVVSGFWDNALLERASKLKYIQSIGAGYDQFPLDELRSRDIRLASASGVNQNAVAEHAMSLMLGLNRHIHTGRDNQNNHTWRGMIGDLSKREDELIGKTLLIVGMGAIGSRLARFAKAFDMRVLATKRDPSTAVGPADEVVTPDRLGELVPQADFLALTCPLTPETTNIVDAGVFKAMKQSAYLINVARGGCVDEPELVAALESGEIAGAGIDHFWEDPLGADSPFWDMKNVIITPHTGGETRLYEERVIDILDDNLGRLWNGETQLRNQIV
ncbi:MAG: D-2-hydroxyacid dehydrogenase [Chloroflexi bacterium]|nr:D-2-hydroxyacid dehydrogenase [Chloroflexota bacterium]MCH8114831.1 D-2-hydroxyacid dehydrogenase [Chloroflexota bacterium]MCI0775825.1 D-2-hydroxyacid dehydrogenase [Chloroflexota bacterium]MCI0804351.1 D-2-hydroxyacid dehydrogenase [Chloroflexota bacterium]MCI0809099.1 D-2-hydroxyacid dehydrogenase [Chloroflexota bacterium]